MAEKAKTPEPAPAHRPAQGQPLPGGTAKSDGMTKMEGVRRALAELGKDAKPLRIRDHLKQRFNIDISPDVVSTYKKELARRAAKAKGTAKPKGKPAAPEAAAGAKPLPTAAPKAQAGKGISLGDIQAVKALVGRVGAEQLRSLVDLLAR
jgi:hypothetical protein